MDLYFPTSTEIVQLLCGRLRDLRLAQQWTQAELGRRAGVGLSTVSNLEAGRNVSFETVVKVAMVLGCAQELGKLFEPQVNSIADIKRFELAKSRKRIRERKDD
ncbi:conserved hypothetical protein [gamma proteobacterium HdN1]|nr:conserved hypothetical protein [gamma proteobacterium HdN1]